MGSFLFDFIFCRPCQKLTVIRHDIRINYNVDNEHRHFRKTITPVGS